MPLEVVGRNSVLDALKSGKRVVSLSIAENARNDPKVKPIVELAVSRQVPIRYLDNELLLRRSPETNPQGVLAEVDMGETVSLKEILTQNRSPLILLFNHLDYEQNLGAILRTAWATGVDAIVVNPAGVHQLTTVIAKVSQGGIFYVPVVFMSLFAALDQLERAAVPLVGVEVKQGKPYFQTTLTGGLAFLFGGEETGLSLPLVKRCPSFIHIPMKGELASLNVSVATAVILFERLRQETIR